MIKNALLGGRRRGVVERKMMCSVSGTGPRRVGSSSPFAERDLSLCRRPTSDNVRVNGTTFGAAVGVAVAAIAFFASSSSKRTSKERSAWTRSFGRASRSGCENSSAVSVAAPGTFVAFMEDTIRAHAASLLSDSSRRSECSRFSSSCAAVSLSDA